MANDRNKDAVDLTASLFDEKTPTAVREQELAKMTISTYLNVQDHIREHAQQFSIIYKRMNGQDQVIAGLPCKDGHCPDEQNIPSEALSIGPLHLSFSGKQNVGAAIVIIFVILVVSGIAAIIYLGVSRGTK